MRRTLLALALIATPALACDQDAMDSHLTAVCEAALRPAEAAIAEALPSAYAPEREAIERLLAAAREGCATGDPELGGRIAVQLARIAGRIEARAGAEPAALLVAAR
jgi:hypothetical protein